jgi:hypothetical protein
MDITLEVSLRDILELLVLLYKLLFTN